MIAKVAHNFSGNKRAFFRYARLGNTAGAANFWGNAADTSLGDSKTKVHNGVFGYTQMFGAATVLDVRLGANWISNPRPTPSLGFKLTSLGLPAALEDYMNLGSEPVFPNFSLTGYTSLGATNGAYFQRSDYNYVGSANLSRVIGRHTLTVGAEARLYFLNFFQSAPFIGAFGPDFTQGPNPRTVSAAAGDSFGSFLLGTASSGNATFTAKPANANQYYAQFVNDVFRATSKLTVNIGMRLEEETSTTERLRQVVDR